MSLLRSATVRALRTVRPAPSAISSRSLSLTARRQSGDSHHHESHFEPPTGWLWGDRPGEKYEKEGWENIMWYMFVPSLIITGVIMAFKPDTSLDTWALEEARRRLEKEGILEDPFPDHKEEE